MGATDERTRRKFWGLQLNQRLAGVEKLDPSLQLNRREFEFASEKKFGPLVTTNLKKIRNSRKVALVGTAIRNIGYVDTTENKRMRHSRAHCKSAKKNCSRYSPHSRQHSHQHAVLGSHSFETRWSNNVSILFVSGG